MLFRSELIANATSSYADGFYKKILSAHDNFSQKKIGEGGCAPTYLSCFLNLNDGRWQLTTENLFNELGATVADGTPDGALEWFLKDARIAHFIGAEWPLSKTKELLDKLPPGAMMLTSFWDTQVRPGHTPETDQNEQHTLWLRRINLIKSHCVVWNSDSLIGGQNIISLENFRAYWHDGLNSKLVGQIVEKPENVGWFVVLGVDERWVRKTIGQPEKFMFGLDINRRIKMSESGRLLLS